MLKEIRVIDNSLKNWLTSRWGGKVRFDEPISKHTSFRVGGPADVYAEPETQEEMIRLIRECRERSVPFTVIGGGTNLLVKDRGIRGIVIGLKGFGVRGQGSGVSLPPRTPNPEPEVILTVSAGMKLGRLCGYCITRGLTGMNFAVGIPGTVGGAAMMNAGTADGSMQDVVESLDVLLSDGTTRHVENTELLFSYRKLEIRGFSFVSVLRARFCLREADPEKLKKEAQNLLKIRRKNQPITVPSAGCFFKNPPESFGRRSAGELIDRAGLKGKQIGGAQISPKHANFIVNLMQGRNSASAADILTLAEIVRETVSEKFGIILETEVKIIGE